MRFLRDLLARHREAAEVAKQRGETSAGTQGADGGMPGLSVRLSKLDLHVLASQTGPSGGVSNMRACAPDFSVPWDQPSPYAYGKSISCYDASTVTGRRSGEPIADCFMVMAYPQGALLAVADGVNWGEPARRAARCAVLGCVSHMHTALQALGGTVPSKSPSSSTHGSTNSPGAIISGGHNSTAPHPHPHPHGGSSHSSHSSLNPLPPDQRTSNAVCKALLASVKTSQKLILQQYGTLTTLVTSVIVKCKWLSQPRQQYAMMTLTVGDSAAYVYRVRQRTVEEVTAASHTDLMRDPRWCPGALGYAMGEDPDLGNMQLSLTLLEEGDVVFLASDGVADNFDPVIRRVARHPPFNATGAAAVAAAAAALASGTTPPATSASLAGGAAEPSTSPAKKKSPPQRAASNRASDDMEPVPAPTVSSHPTDLPALTPRECHESSMKLLGELLEAHRSSLPKGAEVSAQGLTEYLLGKVYEMTEQSRKSVEQKSAERERQQQLALGQQPAAMAQDLAGCDLSLPARTPLPANGPPPVKQPGKMDHATIAAYTVGCRKPLLRAAAAEAAAAAMAAALAANPPPLGAHAVNAAAALAAAGACGGAGTSTSASPAAPSSPRLRGPSLETPPGAPRTLVLPVATTTVLPVAGTAAVQVSVPPPPPSPAVVSLL